MKLFARLNEYAILAALVALSLLPSLPASAQFSAAKSRVATYGATVVNLTPAATATDFFTITGSATKTVQVTQVECAGISTANATALVQLVERSTANTGGTATTLTAIPYDSGDVAPTAVVRSYTANPTLGTLVAPVAARLLSTNTLSTSSITNDQAVFLFGDNTTTKNVILRGTSQVLALNAGSAQSFSAGTALSCDIMWTEK